MESTKDFYRKLIYYLLCSTVTIDIINGFILMKREQSLFGVGIRCIYMCIFLYVMLRNDTKKSILFICSAIVFFSIILIRISYIDIIDNNLRYDITNTVKLLYFIEIYYLVSITIKKQILDKSLIMKILNVNAYEVSIILLLSEILGIGRNTYGVAGFKGVFFGVNELNITLLILLVYLLYDLVNSFKLYKLLMIIINIVDLIMLGTKSSLVFTAIILIFFTLDNKKSFKSKIVIFLGVISIFLIVSGTFFTVLKNQFNSILDRQLYMVTKNNENPITYVLSTRDLFLHEAITNWKEKASVLNIAIGRGPYTVAKEIGSVYGNKQGLKIIEMDLFDIFFDYGVLGILFTYLTVINVFIKSRKEKKFFFMECNRLTIILALSYSMLGGHVFLYPIASTFLAIVMGLSQIKEN